MCVAFCSFMDASFIFLGCVFCISLDKDQEMMPAFFKDK